MRVFAFFANVCSERMSCIIMFRTIVFFDFL